jgi:hypothetical protein
LVLATSVALGGAAWAGPTTTTTAGPTTTTAGPTTTTTALPTTTTTTAPDPTGAVPTVSIRVGDKASFASHMYYEPAGEDGTPEVCINDVDWQVDEGHLLVTRSDTTGPLTVSYAVEDVPPVLPDSPFDNEPGVSYVALPGTVTFEPGQGEARIPVVPIAPPKETWGTPEAELQAPYTSFNVTLSASSGYTAGDPATAHVVIGGDGGSACGGVLLPADGTPPSASAPLTALPRTGPSSEAVLAAVGWVLLVLGTGVLMLGRRIARR